MCRSLKHLNSSSNMSASPASASTPAAAASAVASPYAAAHLNPQGPGDARPTALQVIADLKPDRSLYSSAVVLITGGSSGIGIETARAFATLGAEIYLPVRDRNKAEAVVKDIESTAGVSAGRIHLLDLDLGSLQSVRDCAAAFLAKSNKLNLLINNAGISLPPETTTVDGFELQFATNHLSHFLLTQLLMPTLLASTTPALPSRVISLSSSGHTMSPILFGDYDQKKRGYDRCIGYGQSKTANIYLATEVERRYGSKGVHAAAAHPGFVATGLGRENMEATPLAVPELQQMGLAGPDDFAALGPLYKSVSQGAATTVWAALNPAAKGFCEDCAMAGPKRLQPGESMASIKAKGYAPWAVDEAAAIRLWDESIKMVGL